MAKLLLILLIGLIFEAAGVVLLKKGITQIGRGGAITPPAKPIITSAITS